MFTVVRRSSVGRCSENYPYTLYFSANPASSAGFVVSRCLGMAIGCHLPSQIQPGLNVLLRLVRNLKSFATLKSTGRGRNKIGPWPMKRGLRAGICKGFQVLRKWFSEIRRG